MKKLLFITSLISLFTYSFAFANQFDCKTKFKPYKSAWLNGCQMIFDGKNIHEKYVSSFSNNKILKLNVCLRDPLSLEKAKEIASQLIKIKEIRLQGDKNYWIVRLQDNEFYDNLDKKTLNSWRVLRELFNNYKGSSAKMC